MRNESPLGKKSYEFALAVVRKTQQLIEKREYVLSRQLLKSGTSVGANTREAFHAESRKDFIHKLSIALKEAEESAYWLDLLLHGNYLSEKEINALQIQLNEVLRLLTASIKTAKSRL